MDATQTGSNVGLRHTNVPNTESRQQNAHTEILQRTTTKLRSELGSDICDALDNPKIIEIMVNPDGSIWVDSLSDGMVDTGQKISQERLLAALGTIASMLKKEINRSRPILKGELPLDGSRVQGFVPPVVQSPTLIIRKHSSAVFPMEQYIEEGRISEESWEFLRKVVVGRRNLLIVGGTGSGKTTFVNAILDAMNRFCPNDRLLILEDTIELQCKMKNIVSMRTDEDNDITMDVLVKASLRSRPDRILVGEVRGREALDLLKSWNTGHPGGICTIHANDAVSALTRLEHLTAEASLTPMKALIGEAIDVVVFLCRVAKLGPIVTEILEVKGVNGTTGNYEYQHIYNLAHEGKQDEKLLTLAAS